MEYIQANGNLNTRAQTHSKKKNNGAKQPETVTLM